MRAQLDAALQQRLAAAGRQQRVTGRNIFCQKLINSFLAQPRSVDVRADDITRTAFAAHAREYAKLPLSEQMVLAAQAQDAEAAAQKQKWGAVASAAKKLSEYIDDAVKQGKAGAQPNTSVLLRLEVM